jgi:hypothetical protein
VITDAVGQAKKCSGRIEENRLYHSISALAH